MSYFHTGTRTIIGAEAFHCPVRDGKEWDHLAMVIKLNRSLRCPPGNTANSQSRIGQPVEVTTHDRASSSAERLNIHSNQSLIITRTTKVIGSSLTGN